MWMVQERLAADEGESNHALEVHSHLLDQVIVQVWLLFSAAELLHDAEVEQDREKVLGFGLREPADFIGSDLELCDGEVAHLLVEVSVLEGDRIAGALQLGDECGHGGLEAGVDCSLVVAVVLQHLHDGQPVRVREQPVEVEVQRRRPVLVRHVLVRLEVRQHRGLHEPQQLVVQVVVVLVHDQVAQHQDVAGYLSKIGILSCLSGGRKSR